MRDKLLVLSLVLLACTGCATKGYVNQQLDPLACRVDQIEAKQAALETRVSQVEARLAALETQVSALPQTLDLNPADKAMVSDALRSATESAQRAESAATSAQGSASAAEMAAQRAAKAFELGQKK